MGMSSSYRQAVLCGSTEIRVGSAIFGERPYDRIKKPLNNNNAAVKLLIYIG